jgi:hypothetical protein
MLELFIAELRRYRKAALMFAAASLLIDYLMFRSSDFLQSPYFGQFIGLAAFVFAGMALAIFQFGSYRKPARWLWLLHRPLPRVQTFLAVHLAAVTLIVLAAGIPLELALLATKAEQLKVVDTRHFLGAVHLILFAILGWQTASYTMLARHRFASFVLMLPVMLGGLYFGSAYVLFIPALLCLFLMGCALYTVFRPERHCSARLQPGSVAMAAIPMMLCTYYIMVWGYSVVFNIGFTAVGMMQPHNQVPGGGVEAMWASGDRGLVVAELGRIDDPRAKTWRQEIEPRSEYLFDPNMRHHPVKDAVSNAGYSIFNVDSSSWTFSNDRMGFVAYNYRKGKLTDTMIGPGGAGDPTPYTQPAVHVSWSKPLSLVYTRQTLMLLDHKTLLAKKLIEYIGDEVIASLPSVREEEKTLSIITNRRFIEYEWPMVNGVLKEHYSIPLPGLLSDLQHVAVNKVSDGQLVSILFGVQQEYGLLGSKVVTYHVQGGKVTTLLDRTLALDVGFLYTQHFYWMSPTLFGLFEVPRVLIDTGRVFDAGLKYDTMKLSIDRPMSAHLLALALMLGSAAFAWLRLRREQSSQRYRALWIVACLVIGLPALFTLITLQAKQASKQKASTTNALQPA